MPNSILSAGTFTKPRCGSLRWCWLSVVFIILDQLSKYLVMQNLELYQPYPLLPFLNFTLMYNTGAAFSFLSNHSYAIYFFSFVALAACALIIFWLYKTPANQKLTAFSLALILSGAFSNLIDRVFHGYVIDFIVFFVGNWHFAAFNIADSAITIGAILLGIDIFFIKKTNYENSTR